MKKTLQSIPLVFLGFAALAFADGPSVAPSTAAAPASTQPGQPALQAQQAVKAPKKAKGGNREKDADGTEAPNRFKADTVIKSQYKLNGKQLDVDPD